MPVVTCCLQLMDFHQEYVILLPGQSEWYREVSRNILISSLRSSSRLSVCIGPTKTLSEGLLGHRVVDGVVKAQEFLCFVNDQSVKKNSNWFFFSTFQKTVMICMKFSPGKEKLKLKSLTDLLQTSDWPVHRSALSTRHWNTWRRSSIHLTLNISRNH